MMKCPIVWRATTVMMIAIAQSFAAKNMGGQDINGQNGWTRNE
jgi:hypothetical protein